MFRQVKVVIRGAGDIATGVAVRLWRSGFSVVMTEIAMPLTVRRGVAFSEAVYAGTAAVEGVQAYLVGDPASIDSMVAQRCIPVIVDPEADLVKKLSPTVLIDAVMAKRNTGTNFQDAPLVIGLGPGFTAGRDVHAVIETKRGHHLGRVIRRGAAAPNTGLPGEIMGITEKRVLRARVSGIFQGLCKIGARVQTGEILGHVGKSPVHASLDGVLRGLLHDGVQVEANTKIGDIDPRGVQDYCWTISDKALAIGGGVLEAMLAGVQ
ncbi:MAG: EF2563 family selenium-dependent molybdenum hydroxylase system protein [Desulfohalobiaceae bacterium]|nr:EF2563 family selenium-dependent molybdenum hydroxylase system protein [Desulfohalobiaceae bacterium]